MSAVDSVDSDFSPTDPAAIALDMLVRGISRRDIAAELGVPLMTVHRYVADSVRQRGGEAGTAREAVAVVHATLDDIQRRAYAEIDRDVETTAPLLDVLLGVQRLRAGLTAEARRSTGV
jgi:predicted transcriptional regulator